MTRVYFATNRRPLPDPDNIKDFGTEFSQNGLTDLRFGRAEVRLDGDELKKFELEVAPENLESSSKVLGSKTIFQELQREILDKRAPSATLIFIHGFNYEFREALRDAARLKTILRNHPANVELGVDFNIFLFTWPSNGSMIPKISHPNDRADAAASGSAMARGLLKLADYLGEIERAVAEECDHRIHLLAHSMGNYALRHAVQGARRQVGDDLPCLFDNVFLMAADEDDDAFEHEHKLRLLPKLARRVNVYYNSEDIPLWISDRTKGLPDRLGSDGPRLPRSLPKKVILVDCTDVVTGFQEHHYYLNNKRVQLDMLQVLAGSRPEQIDGRHYDPATNAFRLLELGKTRRPRGGTRRRHPPGR